ncbi:hypothetical protein D9M70_520820 [compost metagenome]
MRMWVIRLMETSSEIASGPTGMPALRVSFSIIAADTPSPSMAMPSLVKVPNTREVKKPRLSLTTIGVFLICST